MENNQKDFMKNRPVASGANQAKDVYGTMKKSSLSILTVVLSLVLVACAVACFFKGRILSGVLFLIIFAILLVSTVVAKRSDYANTSVHKDDHPDAIFKEHED